MKDLKPCPFCGGVAFVQKDGDQYFIKCLHKDNCYLVGRKAQKYNVPEAMIKKWNRRTKDDHRETDELFSHSG